MSIRFAQHPLGEVFAISFRTEPNADALQKLTWLLDCPVLPDLSLAGSFIGARREMITPWSTNAVEICQNMGLQEVTRIERFRKHTEGAAMDNMLEVVYSNLGQDCFQLAIQPEPLRNIEDIGKYNQDEGLALSAEEVAYLNNLSQKLGRALSDSEVFGFSQINSEHCRHKIFNGTFVIDGEKKEKSLFQWIKSTTQANPNQVVSAYKDNVAFCQGPSIQQFAPTRGDKADWFRASQVDAVVSIKAETHNFPTTVEPFNGAATGSGGEIRDRIAGGKGSAPLAGTAVYMTSYSRTRGDKGFVKPLAARKWLYQHPLDILVKASNGASDFGNKFGQPLINGSVFTFEHRGEQKPYAFDKVIMLAGGIGYGILKDAKKAKPQKGDAIVVMGGDNYRIGMGGSAVSSVDTGTSNRGIELNAIQRSNPEMQKRVYNVIRTLMESGENPILSIHDHGAGGHLNCLSELVEDTGGHIEMDKLPVGDPTLSLREILGNESQERMGLVVPKDKLPLLIAISERERAPIYPVGEITEDHRLVFESNTQDDKPVDLDLADLFGNAPKTILEDRSLSFSDTEPSYDSSKLLAYLDQLMELESVACKDWLTNKVDRSVTGRVALQQNSGPLQFPLNNAGLMALDYLGKTGMATAIGHAPAAAMIDAAEGSRLAITEALCNIALVSLEHGIKGLSFSANWMWPCKNPGEDARLYQAVQACSEYATTLGVNIPTGKDSLSMSQKYPDGTAVISPGTVIITAGGVVDNVRISVEPTLQEISGTSLWYVSMSDTDLALGGSAFYQILGGLGNTAPKALPAAQLEHRFEAIQSALKQGLLLAGHDVSTGGLVANLLEMCYGQTSVGLEVNLDLFEESDEAKIWFAENPALLLQVKDEVAFASLLAAANVPAFVIGKVVSSQQVVLNFKEKKTALDISEWRTKWFDTSYLLDLHQTSKPQAESRKQHINSAPIQWDLEGFDGHYAALGLNPNRQSGSGPKAAIIREKGVNGDREMAYALWLSGFEVKDVHMTDLISGREDLSDVQFIVFVGGFSNSDVLGSAKGWAGAFLYNEKAKTALTNFFARPDTLSLGVCNGCQLVMELGLIYPTRASKPKMQHNESGKFESIFLNVSISENTTSILLQKLKGKTLGVWVAHGEGKFALPEKEETYDVALRYSASHYPANPNGSDFNTAGLSSADGRHLAMMPHLERSLFPWSCGYYPMARRDEDLSPWVLAFTSAKEWCQNQVKA